MTITVAGLTKDFGAHRAVNDVSFTAPAGGVTGFIGANGSGKTTTMRMMLGLTPVTSGEAHFGSQQYRDLRQPRRSVGAVIDRIGAHPGHTARQHLTMIAVAANLPMERVDETLAEVELSDVADRPIRQFSMGMTQRCALAAALLGDPPMLILDEPANGLDPSGIRWLRDKTRAWAVEGRTVLVATHQLAELEAVVDHVVLLHEGRVGWHGPAAELVAGDQSLESAVFDFLAGA